MGKAQIYLDHAAATPLDPGVLAAMLPYWSEHFYNPSATYLPAKVAREGLQSARQSVAHWLGARESEVIFTAGGTEANNLAIHGVMKLWPKANIVVSSIEHESVLAPANNYDCRQVKVAADGRLDLTDLERQIDENTALVSVMYANNEIGTVQPIKEIASLVAAKRKQRKSSQPLYLHTDACQAAQYLDLHVARLGVDLMTLNAGKIYGPKQVGALYVKSGLELKPLLEGGGQERGIRSGTENVAGATGLAKALEIAQNMRHAETKRLQELQKQFLEQLQSNLPEALINGSVSRRLPNNVHITIPERDNERLLVQLEADGILAAAGSACSASHETPSHVLRAIGLSDEQAQASLRFTMGRATTRPMIDHTVKVLAKL